MQTAKNIQICMKIRSKFTWNMQIIIRNIKFLWTILHNFLIKMDHVSCVCFKTTNCNKEPQTLKILFNSLPFYSPNSQPKVLRMDTLEFCGVIRCLIKVGIKPEYSQMFREILKFCLRALKD